MPKEFLRKYIFINNSFFEQILRDFYDDKTIFLKTFEIGNVTKREESYWCDQASVVTNYTDASNVLKSMNMIVKVAIYNPYMEEAVEKYDVFKRELLFYQKILPQVRHLFQLIETSDITCNIIRTLNKRPQPKYIVMEELSKDKYLRVQRRSGLNESHLRLTLEKLAKFHASTAALFETNRELFSNHQIPNVSEYFKIFHSMFTNAVEKMKEEIEKENPNSLLVPKLREFEKNMIDKVSEAFILSEDELGVLCHGDLWLHNLLFKYNKEKNPIDVKMVDFGLTYFGSPGLDLAYVLFTSASNEITDYQFDTLIQHYHSTLYKTLILLNYARPIPSLIQIHNHFMKRGIIGVLYAFLLLPMRFVQNDYFKDDDMKERLNFLLDYFNRKGFFE
ncbi:hypothetical protein PVAND_013289 [Polypedilum vanderplanki]|uniref:CHK kinase-like domain-containing protein n=1 Tax=Polypedilum vanderplanki TaxID=319348 RepID=A0A9J6CQ74_POLVA|nr:hypothetical protein PVAND_013289 [Polypedilum vanderplanki]